MNRIALVVSDVDGTLLTKDKTLTDGALTAVRKLHEAGIGFTMSIFIAMLAFADETLLNAAKLGVLLGSLVSAMLGLSWGAIYVRRRRNMLRAGRGDRAARTPRTPHRDRSPAG